jgi:hypothetical protein
MSGCSGEALSALVDGALGHAERERVLAHLTGCDRCRADVEAERGVKARLSALSAEPSTGPSTGSAPAPPPELLDRLRALAVPGAEPTAGPAQRGFAAVRLHEGSGPARPAARRPGAGRPSTRAGRARLHRSARPAARRTGAVGGGLLLAGIGLALALGSPDRSRPSTPVDPGSDAFVVDFVSTTREAPLADPAGGAALLPNR